MHNITERALKCFYEKREFFTINTRVKKIDGQVFLVLYGNDIARIDEDNDVYITTANHNTKTTRERLNGLKGVNVTTSGGSLLLNRNFWDGRWIKI
jgi:hypothetical protein